MKRGASFCALVPNIVHHQRGRGVELSPYYRDGPYHRGRCARLPCVSHARLRASCCVCACVVGLVSLIPLFGLFLDFGRILRDPPDNVSTLLTSARTPQCQHCSGKHGVALHKGCRVPIRRYRVKFVLAHVEILCSILRTRAEGGLRGD